MALPGNPVPFFPRGLYDSLEGTTAPDGACFYLQDLIHDITTVRGWQPRPGAVLKTSFAGFTTPGVVSAALAVGGRIYGMVGSARFAGQDEPFIYDTATNAFVSVANVTVANTPATLSPTGDWIPPDMAIVGTRILVTHQGFGGANFFGWFDISSFSLAFTGSTHTNTLLDVLSVNPLNVGIAVGQRVTGAGVPANTFVVSYTATTITLSQATTATAAGVALTAAGGTLATSLWNAGNTNTNPLPSKPLQVEQFNNRAYFACNNQAWFSDSLNPTNITNATNFITCGDAGTPIVGFGGIPLQQTTGGVLAALIIFKGGGGYWQITGDVATSNILVNGPVGNVGCVAARSIVQTPKGLWFMSQDGVRQVDFSGLISPAPIKGVRYPFDNSTMPTRAAASFNDTVYRISLTTLPNAIETIPRKVDYWYDFEVDEWSGPHTCGFDIAVPVGNTFYFASNDHPAALYVSDISVTVGSLYTEFGAQLNTLLQSCVLPDKQAMAASAICEATIDLALIGGQDRPTMSFLSGRGSVLAIASVADGPVGAPLWGSNLWGTGVWGSASTGYLSYNVNWPVPLVYKKGIYRVTCPAYGGLRIGAFWYRVETLGYMNTQQPA